MTRILINFPTLLLCYIFSLSSFTSFFFSFLPSSSLAKLPPSSTKKELQYNLFIKYKDINSNPPQEKNFQGKISSLPEKPFSISSEGLKTKFHFLAYEMGPGPESEEAILIRGEIFLSENGHDHLLAFPELVTTLGQEVAIQFSDSNNNPLEVKVLPIQWQKE